MTYRADGSAFFVGLERLTGALAGRRGSFVLHHEGTFTDGVARLKLVVVSADGDLRGLRGHASFESRHAEQYRLSLEYGFDEG